MGCFCKGWVAFAGVEGTFANGGLLLQRVWERVLYDVVDEGKEKRIRRRKDARRRLEQACNSEAFVREQQQRT